MQKHEGHSDTDTTQHLTHHLMHLYGEQMVSKGMDTPLLEHL